MSLSSFSVRRKVTVIMIFLGVAVIGMVSLTRRNLDRFPNIVLPVIAVIPPRLGGGAADIKKKVSKVMEDKLSSVPDLDDMASISQDNMSVLQLTFDWGTDL